MISSVFHTLCADVKQRVRQQSYLVILLAMAVLTMVFFPAADASYQTVQVHDYRGVYNSAWMGASLALLNVSFLPLVCFYILKGTIEHDRVGQIGELIAATPVNKSSYILGKWASHVCLMLGMLLCMCITVVFVQLWHGEDYTVSLFHLVLPQIVYVLPILMLVAAVVVLFESIPWLRGGVGNVVYFFLWSFALVQMMFGLSGIGELQNQINQGYAVISSDLPDTLQIGITVGHDSLKTFVWQGIEYSSASGLAVIKPLAVALIILITAIYCFDRFKKASSSRSGTGQRRIEKTLHMVFSPIAATFDVITQYFAFTRLVRQEFLLIIRGWPVWWYVVILGLFIAQLLVSDPVLRGAIVPVSWLLCILALSPLGQRETQNNTQQLVFTAPSMLSTQFPAMIVAGVLLLLMVASGALLRFLLNGDMFSILMLLSGAVFVVLLAVTCGILTKTSRTFEILFTMLWYIGPLNQSTYLDFVGVDIVQSQQIGAPLIFLCVSCGLFFMAYFFRRKQLTVA